LTPRGSEVDPRTEKETLERNSEKETNNAPDGAPPAPPKPPPAVREPNEITLEPDQTEWVCYRGCGETVTWRKGQTACPKCGWPVRFEKAQEPVSEVAGDPIESLEPDTPNGRVLFARLQQEARAKGRRGPKKFPSLACKRKFTEAERRLDEHFQEALDAGLVKGITSVSALVNWLARYRPGRKSGKKRRPLIDENTLAAVYQDMEAY
jgi:hypothetical protein